jgi:hypothetical protein
MESGKHRYHESISQSTLAQNQVSESETVLAISIYETVKKQDTYWENEIEYSQKKKKENFNATKKIKRRSIVLLYLELQPVGSSFCDLQRWW